jgi:hypothetical protein
VPRLLDYKPVRMRKKKLKLYSCSRMACFYGRDSGEKKLFLGDGFQFRLVSKVNAITYSSYRRQSSGSAPRT